MSLLTGCLIVKNESVRLAGCLASLEGLVDALVVVDTGSDDDTVAIATQSGAKVHVEPWRDDFSHARNCALSLVTTPWALIIDADEHVEDTDKAETRARLTSASELPDILLVREWLMYPDDREILLLAPRILKISARPRFIHPIHEQLAVEDAPAALSNVVLRHHGYAEPGALRTKERRNLRIAEAMERNPHALHCIARAALSLGEWGKGVEAAGGLLGHPQSSPVLRREACVLGALASLSARDGKGFSQFVAEGMRLDPRHLDIQFLNLLSASARYAAAARREAEGPSSNPLRPGLLWHDGAPVEAMIRTLTRRAAHIPDPGDDSGRGHHPQIPESPNTGWR